MAGQGWIRNLSGRGDWTGESALCSLAWKEEETERAGEEEVGEVWLVEGVPASWLLFSIEFSWLAVELGV